MTDRYTAEEIEMLRAQLREGNRIAREVAIRHGVKVHPRIAALRSPTTPDLVGVPRAGE